MEKSAFRGLVPPSGGSLEIGNRPDPVPRRRGRFHLVPPSGGSLEIGNPDNTPDSALFVGCSPFGGSLEIGNTVLYSL